MFARSRTSASFAGMIRKPRRSADLLGDRYLNQSSKNPVCVAWMYAEQYALGLGGSSHRLQDHGVSRSAAHPSTEVDEPESAV